MFIYRLDSSRVDRRFRKLDTLLNAPVALPPITRGLSLAFHDEPAGVDRDLDVLRVDSRAGDLDPATSGSRMEMRNRMGRKRAAVSQPADETTAEKGLIVVQSK